MKRIVFIITIVLVIIILSVYSVNSLISQTLKEFSISEIFDKTKQPSPDKQDTPPHTIRYHSGELAYDYFLSTADAVRLVENSASSSSSDLSKINLCRTYVNGGYYTSDMKPLGLFVVNGERKYPRHESATLNGVLAITETNDAGIEEPKSISDDKTYRLALQAGPILIKNSNARTLILSQDSPERRVIAGILSNATLFFLVIYDGHSAYLGPYLKDLPDLLVSISDQEGFVVTDAINLDGGTASVFKGTSLFLNEFKNVGSVLCIK